ncbi:MAG: hypothetical protein KatS3mg031_3058 [Chitinophagales bacterium]|nr:MAG: hypothetical protein KatS3mg031_3058 [Chitinophagales bacterium]
MKQLIIILVILLNFIHGQGQNTFHKLIYTDFPLVRFTAVLPTDSCYYFTGTFVDTISPLRTGAMFGKIDLNGELLLLKVIKHPDILYFNDLGDLFSTAQGNLVNVGIKDDFYARAILYLYNQEGDTILTKEYLSILYPKQTWLVPKAVRIKPDGGFIILIGHESLAYNDFDISLLILDSEYNILHYKAYGTAFQETARSVILDNDGGFIIGADRNNLNLTSTNFSSRTYIIKTDSTGEVIWQYLSPPGILQDEAKAMIKTPDGGLVVASGIGIEVPVHPTLHYINWDAMIFKLDADRNVVWSTPLRGVFPTTQTGLVEMVASADGSGFVAVGKVADDVSGPEPMSGSWIVKVSPKGDSLWARYYTIFDGVDVDPTPYDLKQTPDGGYVIVGTTLNLGQTAPGWIMKVDEYGCLVPGCHLVNASEENRERDVRLTLYPNPASDFLNVWYYSADGKGASFKVKDLQGKTLKSFETKQRDVTLIIPVWDYEPGIYFLQCFEGERLVRTEKFVVE